MKTRKATRLFLEICNMHQHIATIYISDDKIYRDEYSHPAKVRLLVAEEVCKLAGYILQTEVTRETGKTGYIVTAILIKDDQHEQNIH